MKLYIISFALVLHLAAYSLFSIKTKSWLNIMTPTLLLSLPAMYLFELMHVYVDYESGSDLGYLIVYLLYTLPIVAFVLAYLYIRPLPFATRIASVGKNTTVISLAFLVVAVLMYLPIMLQFSSDLFNPRAIYTATRTGFGTSYYGSIVASYIFLILALFNGTWSWRGKALALLFCMIFAYLHGSKGQMLTVIFLAMLYRIVTSTGRVKFWVMALLATVFGALGVVIFYSMTQGIDPEQLLMVMANYSDYNRNAVMLIDSDRYLQWGRIFFEDNLFSRIPRALYPDKPKDFGSFSLALEYFPSSFYRDEGVPSFGLGVMYADFGILAVVMNTLWGIFSGIVSRTLMARLRLYRSPADFVLLCFFSGVILIPIGAGNLLPEHFVLACMVYWIASRKSRSTPGACAAVR